MTRQAPGSQQFVHWFRNSAPYINAFRGRTFVICCGGELLGAPEFTNFAHDIVLLHSLGIRLVLVHGARPQIEQRLKDRHAESHFGERLRVTDATALSCAKEAAGTIQVEIEAMLSMGLANSPTAGARLRVITGNFVTARPVGVRDGIDYQHTGEVRRVDAPAIRQLLENGAVVVLSPIGYSPTGEVFNLSAEDVASASAIALQADKLIYLMEDKGLLGSGRRLIRELSVSDAERLLRGRRPVSDGVRPFLDSAIQVCRKGVRRVHLLSREIDGALLQELFSRDGIGTLISADPYENLRQAQIDDVAGILELITPLERDGLLVRRSREAIEVDLDHYTLIERDGMVIGVMAFYPFTENHAAELACLAVHPDYRNGGRGDRLLAHAEKQARLQGCQQLFVLSTRTMHWFRERGFHAADIGDLPVRRKAAYNYQRNSKVFIKEL